MLRPCRACALPRHLLHLRVVDIVFLREVGAGARAAVRDGLPVIRPRGALLRVEAAQVQVVWAALDLRVAWRMP